LVQIYRPAKSIIFFLKTFKLSELVSSHATMLLAPAIKGLLRDLDFPDRINTGPPLTNKHLNLA
jgi:hypothetical protein